MMIDRLGSIDPVSKFNKAEKASKPTKKGKTDSIDLSAEAKAMGEMYKASENVKQSPDIRQDRVNEVKEKLKDPSYISDKIIESVAESVMDLFKI